MTYVPLPRRTPLARGRARLGASAKTRAAADLRRAIVAQVIAASGGRCARCGDPAVEGHEPASRGRFPGSHLISGLVVASCRRCNTWATTHPAEAEAIGWLLPSGLSRREAVARTAKWKERVA